MQKGKEYRLAEICEVLGLKETRTKVLLRSMVADGKVEAIGGNRDRKYRLPEKI